MGDGATSPVCVRLTDDEIAKLDDLAALKNLSRSSLLREVVVGVIRSKGQPSSQGDTVGAGQIAGLEPQEGTEALGSGVRAPWAAANRVAGGDEVLGNPHIEPFDSASSDERFGG